MVMGTSNRNLPVMRSPREALLYRELVYDIEKIVTGVVECVHAATMITYRAEM